MLRGGCLKALECILSNSKTWTKWLLWSSIRLCIAAIRHAVVYAKGNISQVSNRRHYNTVNCVPHSFNKNLLKPDSRYCTLIDISKFWRFQPSLLRVQRRFGNWTSLKTSLIPSYHFPWWSLIRALETVAQAVSYRFIIIYDLRARFLALGWRNQFNEVVQN